MANLFDSADAIDNSDCALGVCRAVHSAIFIDAVSMDPFQLGDRRTDGRLRTVSVDIATGRLS